MAAMSERTGHAPPFYCPYCGEEDIRPFGERHGEWVCGSCRRAWALRSIAAGGSVAGGVVPTTLSATNQQQERS
jgi:transposase-like protein